MRKTSYVAVPLTAGVLLSVLAGAAPAAPTIRAEDVLAHLEQTISLYRDVSALEQSPALANDIVLRDTARRTSVQALQRAFDFARAQATLLSARGGAAANAGAQRPGTAGRMEQVVARAAGRVASIQARLKDLDAAVAKATAQSRQVLLARRKQALAELYLAEQIHKSAQSMVAFVGTAGAANAGLANRIDQLERSVPEAMRTEQRAAEGSSAAAPVPGGARVFRAESAGLMGLAGELFTLTRTRSQLSDVIETTEALLKRTAEIRQPLTNELRTFIRRSDSIAAAAASDDPELLAASYFEVESLTARFKEMSTVLTPLREQAVLMETSRGNLLEWRSALDRRYAAAGGYLLMRAAVLGVAIALVLIVSAFWRRMTFRYAKDPRRRRQFLVMRRIVVSCAIALVVVLGFVSEVGSLATYAGFLTAGLAVALQNPIVSVVAYFFLIGRYGLRVGDRVTISGVMGEVIEIGLVRMYVMELAGKGGDLRPTGRVVAFSNSVLFQPAALFKQMPGTDYVWHTVSLSLTPDCDPKFAETKLMEAVNTVFEQYRESIEQQHAIFERAVDMKIAPPLPQASVRFIDGGLEFSVRYPAETRVGSSLDARLIQALTEVIAREPSLTLARSGEAKLLETA